VTIFSHEAKCLPIWGQKHHASLNIVLKLKSALTLIHATRELVSKLKSALTLWHAPRELVSRLKSRLTLWNTLRELVSRLKSVLTLRHAIIELVSKLKSTLTLRHATRELASKLKSALALRHALTKSLSGTDLWSPWLSVVLRHDVLLRSVVRFDEPARWPVHQFLSLRVHRNSRSLKFLNFWEIFFIIHFTQIRTICT
jgi:hypothetical protein